MTNTLIIVIVLIVLIITILFSKTRYNQWFSLEVHLPLGIICAFLILELLKNNNKIKYSSDTQILFNILITITMILFLLINLSKTQKLDK